MKEVLVVIAMAMYCYVSSQAQLLVPMNENDNIGKQYGPFQSDCNSVVTWNVTNFPKNYFQVNRTADGNIIVFLQKNFNRSDFKLNTTGECRKKAEYIFINVYCTSPTSSIVLKVVSFTFNDTSAPYCCDSNCSKIESPYRIEILENTTINTDVTPPLKICDEDIVYGNTQPQYSPETKHNNVIEYTTSGLRLITNLDYETNKTFNASIIIGTDDRSNQSTLQVNVIVKDVDDLGLAFDNIMYNCSIPENQMGIVQNCRVMAKDLDTEINTTVEYALVSESPKASVVLVNKTSGVITVNEPLDRESVPVIFTYIKGYQVNCPYDKVNYTTVIINVVDVDDHAPTMLEHNISINITENIPIGTIVYQATAVDKFDEGDNAMFVYNMTDSSGLFELNNSTGLVTTKKEIDKENITSTSVNIEIKAVSSMNSSLTSNTSLVNITILDENDNNPVFQTNNSTNVTISKKQELNVCIFKVNATDKDSGENGKVKYRIEHDFDVFSIDNDTGDIKLKSNLSESFSFVYRLAIIAEDQAKQFKRSSIMILRVDVRDENIHLPVFVDLPQSINTSECIPSNTTLLKLKITKGHLYAAVEIQTSSAEDKDPTDKLTFKLKSHGDVFSINNSSLRTIGSLDRETVSSYNITLAVSDSLHEVNETVQIFVEDVNDNTPQFVNQSYCFKVNETTDGDSTEINVGEVQASDADIGDNGNVTYKIDSSQWNSNISIDTTTGAINVTKLDRDIMGEDGEIQLTILAIDAGIPKRTGVTTVTMQVLGVNEYPPIYPNNSKHVKFNVAEGDTTLQYKSQVNDRTHMSATVRLSTFSAYDNDVGVGSNINYTISTDTNGSFSINADTGLLTIDKPLKVTDSNNEVISFTIVAQNSDGKKDEQNITVFVQDINDHSPKFVNSSYTSEIKECVVRDKAVLRVNATDADFTKEFNTVYYWIETGNDTFYIDSNTGEIYLIGNIDYDKMGNSTEINFIVFATDVEPYAKNDSTNVTFRITDCNDNPPVFTRGMYLCNISEGETGNLSCEVQATDADKADKIHYNITHLPQYYQNFMIDHQTGVISVNQNASFDYESMESNPVFLNVSASDGNFTKYAAVVVTILDVNDEPPVFQNTPYEFVTAENTETLPHYIGFINVTDADSAINLSIVNCSDSSFENPFLIKNSVEVFSNTQLDFELRTEYVCTIQASDSNHTIYANVTIRVQDVNDNSPFFKNNYSCLSLNETFETKKTFITVNATDEDKNAMSNEVTYSIFAGDVLKLFSINNCTGDIQLDKSLDKFGGKIFELKIKATDNGEPPLTGYTTVQVNVVATNNNPPKFIRKPYRAFIYENSGNQSVFQVSAEDSDGTENLTFSVANNTDFCFNENGILFAKELDAEKYNRSDGVCYFRMTVSDGVNDDNTTAVITIIDKNDNYPAFDQTEYKQEINDTTNVQTEILTVAASDRDITNDGFTFILRDSQGDFDINSTTGQVSLLRPLGQNGVKYEMIVVVIDSGNPSNHNQTNITITINDTNNPPKFDSKVTNQTVNENDNSLRLSFAADDEDIGQAGNVTYSITSSNNDLNIFRFDSTTASLTLANTSCTLDFEEQPIFHFTITAKDHGAFTKYATANVTIYVKDINEAPYISGCCDRSVYVELNTPVYTPVCNVSATDPDVKNESYNKLTYALEGNDIDSKFDVHNNGTIYSNTTIDKSGNYSFNLTIKDNGNLTVTEQCTIVVPKIENSTKHVNVSENVEYRNLTQLDRIVNGYEVYYEIHPSDHSGKFSIDTNRVLSLSNAFDKESTEQTFLWIYGRSVHHHDILLVNITVNIEIVDVNDCAPVFQSDKHLFIVDDIMEKDTLVGEVLAVDRDFEPRNKNITYSLTDDEHGYFHIEKTGEIFLGNISSIQAQNFTLLASAGDGKFLTNTTVVIRVLDTNNHSPQFNQSKYEFDMAESNCTATPCDVGTALATDRDLKNNGNISYTIIAGSDLSFTIENGNGLIQAVANIDREENERFILTVCASDMGHRPRQSCIPVTINVRDLNDNTPVFHEADNYTASVVENSANGSKVQVVPGIVALDIDKGDNGTEGLTYSLNVTDGPFCITNHYPVSVYICGRTDRETQNIYYLSVEVYDIGNRSASLPLIVHIEDENDESPVFTESLYRFNVTENANASEYVGKISVTDRDLNGTDDIIYRINNDDASPIYIDGITGALYVGGKIDREKDVRYVLNISAYDGKNFNYTKAEIVVNDVNDNAPDFGIPEKEIITINVTENVEYGVILNITVEDKDEEGSINSEIIFKLSGDVIAAPSDSHTLACDASSVDVSNDSCLFTITQTGQLNLTRTLDREVQDHYSLTVTVSDKGATPLSSSMTVYINVLDENDHDPVFIVDGMTGRNYAESYTVEKIPVNSVLKLIDTNDVDFGINGTVTYSIVKSPFSNYFKIGKSSGVVKISQAISVNTLMNIPSVGEGILDLNDTAILNLTISATDGGGRESNMTLSVFIEPLNDEAPVFDEMVFNFTIPENEANGSYVGNCVARIANETNSHMNYILIGGYEHTRKAFMIDSKTGLITTSIPLDRESVAQYTFAVQVRDGRIPERTAFAEVEIKVSDVNDNSPVFHSNDVNVQISENSLPRVFNVSARDRDLGKNGSITYSLVNDYDGLFILNSTNGLLNASGPFDFEDKNQYRIEIVASDGGLPHQMNTSIFVNVSITDENDNAPHFNDTITSLNIKENSPPQKVFNVRATDEDSGWNGKIIYELIDKELTPFVINAFSGDVYLRGHVDFEQRPNYTLTIQAKDQGEPPLCVNKTVDVNVIDIYDDIPKFEHDTYEVTLSSTTAVTGAFVIELDVGISDIEYIISGQDATYFKVVGHNLTLREKLNIDRNLFLVTVTAKDKVNQTTSCSVIVHTRGHIILFPNEEFPVNVAENLETDSILVDLNTTEEFLPGPGIIYSIYSVIPSGIDPFFVNESTGVVSCNKALDRETVSQYIITISARSKETRRKRDVPALSSITRIIVNVTDVNDNPPKFPESQSRVFGVPDNVRANYIVTTLQAFDPDVDGAGNIRYNITGGRSDVFGVDQRMGNIITLVAIATVKDKLLNLTVTAYDKEKKEDKADIVVLVNVVPSENQPYLIVDKSVANFIARKDEIIKNMSRILGVEIQSDKIEGHLSSDGAKKRIHVDLSKTDFYFHGFINSSGNYSLVSNEEMERLLRNASKELASIFGNRPEIGQYHESQDPISDPSAITSTQILLICMAVFIFFGAGSALLISNYSWSRYNIDCKMDKVKKEDREGSEIELSTLRSRQSSKMSSTIATAVTNPAYQETELTGNENVNNQTYESQKIRLHFSEETRSNSNFGSPGGIDSGLANTSVHSSTNHTLASSDTPLSPDVDEHDRLVDGLEVLSEHGPAMTSSPRPSRSVFVGGEPSPSDEQEAKQSTQSNILIINTHGVTETDDEIDDKDDSPENVIDASADPEDIDFVVGNADSDANNIDSGASNVDTGTGNVDMENEDITDHHDQTNDVDSVTEITSF